MEADTKLSCNIPPDKTSEGAVHDLKSDTSVVEKTVSETRENNNTSEVSLLASNFKDLTIISCKSIAKPATKKSCNYMESEVDILEGNPVISELCEQNDDNGSSTAEYAESTDDPTRPGKKRKVGSCPNVKCVDADDYMLTCSCCKHKHHYSCSDLPPYQIV